MGTSNSTTNPYGSIFIRTEKPFYHPGEQVVGTIYLELLKEYPGNVLILKIKGKEETHYNKTQGVRHPGESVKSVQHRGRNLFYNHRVVIFTWNKGTTVGASPGQYTFTFSFVLNSFLPSSFKLSQGDTKAVIRYKLKTELEPFHQDEYKKKSVLKHTQDLILRQPDKHRSTQIGEINIRMSTWYCLNQGNSLIRCYLEKSSYASGEQAYIICEVDNSHCSLPISRIMAELKCRRTLSDDQGDSNEYQQMIFVHEFDGVPPGVIHADETRKIATVTLRNIQEDTPLQATTSGQLIKCYYFLDVVVEFAGCLCGTVIPHLEVPVVIVMPEPPEYYNFKLPQKWFPIPMETLNLILSEGNFYPTKEQKETSLRLGESESISKWKKQIHLMKGSSLISSQQDDPNFKGMLPNGIDISISSEQSSRVATNEEQKNI